MLLGLPGVGLAEGSHDHEQLTTRDGQVFRAIRVIDSDPQGLTFRHREGIAKIPFDALSPAYRLLYETVEEAVDTPEALPAAAPSPAALETPDRAGRPAPSSWELHIRLHWRALVPTGSACGAFPSSTPPGQHLAARGRSDHGTLFLSHARHRERVLRSFLLHQGLLTTPPCL